MADPVPAAQPNIYLQTPEQLGQPTMLERLQMLALNPTNDPRIRALTEQQRVQAAQQQPPAGQIQTPPGIFTDPGKQISDYWQGLKDNFKQLNTDNNRKVHVDQALEDANNGINRILPNQQVGPQSSFDPRALNPQVRAQDLSRFG